LIRLTFHGAARTVTGSQHLLETNGGRLLLDCGLYQGRRGEAAERNRKFGFDPKTIDAVVLSHAHIDHSGSLPTIFRMGFQGNVFGTPATRDLAAVMLRDAAFIQAQDAEYLNRRAASEGKDERVEPLYDEEDALEALAHFISVPYRRPVPVLPDVRITFLDAGHVLGSAVTVLEVQDGARTVRLAFTGDLGRKKIPILADPEVPEGVGTLISESTYGDRLHDPIEKMDEDLAAVVKRTAERGGRLVVPTFALERAQEVIYALRRLLVKKAIPELPVYVDSPLTVRITDVFKLHPEHFDEDLRNFMREHGDPFSFPKLRYVSDVEASKEIQRKEGPYIVLSASGMCEAGRILHHLKGAVEEPKNTILIVGYQAEHTLGRRIVERRPRVKIFGVERDLKAEVVVLNGFSAHADRNDLLAYATHCRDRGPLERIMLVHGEPKPMDALQQGLEAAGHRKVFAPEPGTTLEI
jgi:metallo-beta-lactamase family protein